MEQEIEIKNSENLAVKTTKENKKNKNNFKPFKKRKALHSKANLNELYVKNETHISIYIKRIHKLIKDGYNFIIFSPKILSLQKFQSARTIIIHGMTASIPKCVQIALHMSEYYSDITTEIETGSANTIIDHIPVKNQLLYSLQIKIALIKEKKVSDEDVSDEEQMDIKIRSTIHITLKKELNF
ncbi:hypothetical protein ABPG73_015755 [Tetrahymena malaccensis]